MDFPFGFFFGFWIVTLVALVFWIWALIDAIRVPDDSLYKGGTKLIWVLVIVLASWIGALVYLVVGRPDGGANAAVQSWGSRSAGVPAGLPPPPPPPPA
jgi:Phospholipase_D-nuclease N-terminal